MKSKIQIDYFFDKHKLNKEHMEDFKKIYPYIEAVITEEQSPIYENMVFFKINNITQRVKLELIELFLDSYFNTAIAKSAFSPEYVTVTSAVLEGLVPLKLEYLNVEEIYTDIYEIISRSE